MASYQTAQTVDARVMGGMFSNVILRADGAAAVNAGVQATAFLDRIGQNIASGFPQGITRADANQFGGEIPAGERFFAWGCQVQFVELAADVVTAGVNTPTAAATGAANALAVANAIQNVSLELNLKGQTYQMGGCTPLPSGHGSNGLAQNGGSGSVYFRFPDALPLDLGPNDRFSIRYRCERNFAVQNALGGILIYTYLPTLRGVDLGNLAGA